MGKPSIDRFTFRVSHQLTTYVAWRKDHTVQQQCILKNLEQGFFYAFPPLCLIAQILNKMGKDKTKKINNTMLVDTVVVRSNNDHVEPLIINQSLTLVTWMASGYICLSFCQGSQSYLQFKETELFDMSRVVLEEVVWLV